MIGNHKHNFRYLGRGSYRCRNCDMTWIHISYAVHAATTNPKTYLELKSVNAAAVAWPYTLEVRRRDG